MANGFSIHSVEIEGFKGFAEPTEVNFNGRHVFLLGPNGNGKSSIVEAVRWGLFGSTFRPNEMIKNRHYQGDCRVTIKLVRGEDLITLRRILNLGAGSTSEAILTDQHGKVLQRRSILPQLDSVDAGEGTHIIFAPQSAPLTKQPADIDPFERTVFNYLGLTHPRALMSNIGEFLTDQTESEEKFDDELSGIRKKLDAQIFDEQDRITRILAAPPWDGSNIPSTLESTQRARRFVQEITGASSDDDRLTGLPLMSLLDRAQTALDEKKRQGPGDLEKEKSELEGRRGRLQNLRSTEAQVAHLLPRVEELRSRVQNSLNGLTLDELREKLETAQYEADTESIKKRIAQDTIILLERSESDEVDCPVCEIEYSRDELDSSLQDMAQSDNTSSTVASLKAQLETCERLDDEFRTQESGLQQLSRMETYARNNMDAEDKRRLSDGYTIDQLIEDYEKLESDVAAQIDGHGMWLRSKQAELNGLKEEGRFHQIRELLERLQSKRRQFEDIEASYDNLVLFGQSVREIQKVSQSAFSEQFGRESPRVSDVLSRSFNALTQHPWYDQLVVLEKNGKLELQVASTQDTLGLSDPTGVLNGQAESALSLVPYFAFSQNDDNTPTEVYLVMLDDPTRALDTEHIRILVERLRELGNNVQLIVASQETERFQGMIPQVFEQDRYIIVEPTGWSPGKSPSLNISHV